jgi:hypothetical protein
MGELLLWVLLLLEAAALSSSSRSEAFLSHCVPDPGSPVPNRCATYKNIKRDDEKMRPKEYKRVEEVQGVGETRRMEFQVMFTRLF